MKCSKCNKDNRQGFERTAFFGEPLNFCSEKCLNEWENSECCKNYDTNRLKKLEDFIKENEKNGNPQDHNLDMYKEEAQKIRDKWSIGKQNPQEKSQPVNSIETKNTETSKKENQGNSKIVIFIVIGILGLAILGGIGWYFWQKQK